MGDWARLSALSFGMLLVTVLLTGCARGAVIERRDSDGSCTPDCAGRECGDNGCGTSCGACVAGDLCNARGLCYDPKACTPDCTGRACGGDGCGADCGACARGELCNARGTCYDPNTCVPDCQARECGDDGCGADCGTCAQGDLCNAQGACYDPNTCIPDCQGKECGDDGCGADCGTCAQGDLCNAQGSCYDPRTCVPDCQGKECGDDGCGASCGTCIGSETCNAISGQCAAPVGLVWTDSIQSEGEPFGFDAIGTNHPIGTSVTPSDANGANVSKVPDPLGGPGYAIRQYGVFDASGARSQLGLWSFRHEKFRALALSGEPVYVAQELYFPEKMDAGGSGRAWLSLLDWHTTLEGTGRWHTSPGVMLKQDGSMKFLFAWGRGAGGEVNDSSNWSTLGLPVGEWFDLEMRWQFASDQTATISIWINGKLALEQVGVATAGEGHEVVELYIKLYGSDQGGTPWHPVGITKYVRNVRVSGERIWR